MRTYELRRSDGQSRTYVLPDDASARNYAAVVTERGVRVEIWADGRLVWTTYGTRDDVLPGAWEFDHPPTETAGSTRRRARLAP